jgi:peptidoglycan/xylan/chitin deacetylase (PgdA/CDA1 family)
MIKLRSDRAATLYLFHPLKLLFRLVPTGIPILMYHSISCAPEVSNRPYLRTHTDPRIFRRQIEFLYHHGYRTIGVLAALEQMRRGSTTRMNRQVVLTFDDGYGDFYSEAFPVLSEYGYTATVFLSTGFIDSEARHFTGKYFSGEPALTWRQVRELSGYGIEFGSHTVTHPQLCELPISDVAQEVRYSKSQIEDQTGIAITQFSYPLAFPRHRRDFTSALKRILSENGYFAGVCTTIGTATDRSDPHFLERLPVNSFDDDALLAAKLIGSYDWLRHPQTVYKFFRG